MRRSIQINGETFSVTAATELYRKILKQRELIKKDSSNYEYVLWILKERRPNLIIDESLQLKVDLAEVRDCNCFWYKSGNNVWESFSYKKALESKNQKIVSKENITYSKKDYLDAFRASVYDQIKSFREKELKKNSTLALLDREDSFKVHTDHIIPMHLLISDFLRDKGIKLKDVEITKIPKFNMEVYILADKIFEKEWQVYHKQKARLKLLTCEENLIKAGSQDLPLYYYKKSRSETYD